jgi:recombination protein RecR
LKHGKIVICFARPPQVAGYCYGGWRFSALYFEFPVQSNGFMEPRSIKILTELLKKLPAVGQKTAERYGYALKNFSKKDLELLAQTLADLKKNLGYCSLCQATIEKTQTKNSLCSICANPQRNPDKLCIVEDEQELAAMEQTSFKGVYFVLGELATFRTKDPGKNPSIELLKRRLKKNPPQEIILAFSPTVQGQAVYFMLKKELNSFGIPVTRLGLGLPSEADLRYADQKSLQGALDNRQRF